MRAYSYAWSHEKDGGHAIRIAENPILHANLMALSVIEPELWSIKVLHCRNQD